MTHDFVPGAIWLPILDHRQNLGDDLLGGCRTGQGKEVEAFDASDTR